MSSQNHSLYLMNSIKRHSFLLLARVRTAGRKSPLGGFTFVQGGHDVPKRDKNYLFIAFCI